MSTSTLACGSSRELLKAGFHLQQSRSRVVIGSVERYDLVKIKLTESEADHPIRLRLCRLRSSEN